MSYDFSLPTWFMISLYPHVLLSSLATRQRGAQVESALASSTRVLNRRERDVQDAQKLCVIVFNGCNALLQQLTRAQKAMTDPGGALPQAVPPCPAEV
jgi:hypothetical protein